jgi:AcrR family transcriptional regulator
MTFQRARTEDQREIRRKEILDTVATMLGEMPMASISLNELSRRVGLAKSNVLRYFESREAILLELLVRAWSEWLTALPPLLAEGVIAQGSVQQRGDQIARVIARSLGERRVFCDLFSSHASVLEHNVSGQVAARFKHAALANVTALAQQVRAYLPELGDQAWQVCAQLGFAMSAIWMHSRPSAGVLAAAKVDPSLVEFRIDFEQALATMVATLISGTLARPEGFR